MNTQKSDKTTAWYFSSNGQNYEPVTEKDIVKYAFMLSQSSTNGKTALAAKPSVQDILHKTPPPLPGKNIRKLFFISLFLLLIGLVLNTSQNIIETEFHREDFHLAIRAYHLHIDKLDYQDCGTKSFIDLNTQKNPL